MHHLDTRRQLCEHLSSLALDPEHLDPWLGWKAFKEFLKREVADVYDAAAVQFLPEGDGGSMFFVRQFTERANQDDDAPDVLVGCLIVQLQYEAQHVPEDEVWTLDYPTLEEWASVVEGLPAFQDLVNRIPTYTDVYYSTDS